MKAYEAIKRLKMDRKEFLELYGIKSHMSNIPVELESELFGSEKKIQVEQERTQTVNSAETIVVGEPPEPIVEPIVAEIPETKTAEECPYSLHTIKRSIQIFGGKSKLWKWRHLIG